MKLEAWEPDLQSLVDRIKRNDIDLQPDFQRQEIWNQTKKKRLIDTILRNWSIPPIHLVVTADNILEVLDGQQRLSSIRDFFDNEFSIDGRITPHDEDISAMHGLFYSGIPRPIQRRIEQYTLRCFKISEYQPDEPSELFYRLNQPTILTAGEQRNALYGPAREQLKELVGEFERNGNNKSTLGFSNSRLAYDDVIARLLFFLEAGTLSAKATESRISDRFRSREGFSCDVVERIRTSLRLFSQGRSSSSFQRFNKASLLSWLLFYSRHNSLSVCPEYMQVFSEAREGKFAAHCVTEATSLFDDRASLRVTDVSSVVYRDFCLWYVYYFIYCKEIPRIIPVIIIEEVEKALSVYNGIPFEGVVSKIVNISAWSKVL